MGINCYFKEHLTGVDDLAFQCESCSRWHAHVPYVKTYGNADFKFCWGCFKREAIEEGYDTESTSVVVSQ